MGNLCSSSCFQSNNQKKQQQVRKKKGRSSTASKRFTNPNSSGAGGGGGGSSRWSSRVRSSQRDDGGAPPSSQETLAASAIFFQHNAASLPPFDRSASLRYPPPPPSSSNKKFSLPRSSSQRARSLTDPLLQPHQLLNDQNSKLDELESSHFVLIHGGCFGAWCWYKSIALLEETGFKVTAIDLMGSGIHSSDSNGITTLSEYIKPLTNFLEKLSDGEKIILLGHDFGGACISYAMELFPSKISKAIFIAAAMLTNGQSTLDMFSQVDSGSLMREAQIFLYANGNDQPPTAIDLDKSLLKNLLFNRSPTKDVALASVSMRPLPFAPVLEKLSLSETNYGSVRRFYIKTMDDNAIPLAVQDRMIDSKPPEAVFQLKGSDHSPFFSKPQALHKLLLEISKIA